MTSDLEQLKRDAFAECERRGYVMLSREIAREVFTAIPSPQDRDRTAALETMLGAAQRHCQRVESERDEWERAYHDEADRLGDQVLATALFAAERDEAEARVERFRRGVLRAIAEGREDVILLELEVGDLPEAEDSDGE